MNQKMQDTYLKKNITVRMTSECTKSTIIVKRVRFDDQVTIHRLCVYAHAQRLARTSNWQQVYLDHLRFKKRINDLSAVLSPFLTPSHRAKIYQKMTIRADADMEIENRVEIENPNAMDTGNPTEVEILQMHMYNMP